MTSDHGFAFLVPLIFFCFGCCFLVLEQWSRGPSRWWGAGYLCAAGGFLTPWAFQALPVQFQASIADFLFLAAAYLNSAAVFLHFGPVRLPRTRFCVAVVTYGGTLFAVHALNSLPIEVLIADFGFVILLASPLVIVWNQARTIAEKLLLGLVALVAINTVVRNILLGGFIDDGAPTGFAQSTYAYAMQATDAVLGMLLALTAMANIALAILTNLRNEAERDPLTHLHNRRGFDRLVPEFGASNSNEGSVLTCDIDHFKAINDKYGHAVGDRVLVFLSEVLTEHVPSSSVVSRFGGEEFVLYLPHCGLKQAEDVADSVRVAFSVYGWEAFGITTPVTVSFGVATSQSGDHSVHDVIKRADDALYVAKAAGRNRVVSQHGPKAANVVPLRFVSGP